MKKAKLFTIVLIVTILVLSQFAMASAAPLLDTTESISGSIDTVSVVTEAGMTFVEITIIDEITGEYRTVRVSGETANDLGLVEYDDDGNPLPVDPELWPESITILLEDILPSEEEAHHPVGNALAAFFTDLPGVDYNVIMTAHQDGYGFGLIAQALWLTQKMGGDSDVLMAVLEAKETGDFSAFTLADGSNPTSWGQFKKVIMDGDKKTNLGVVMSAKDKDHGNAGNNGNGGAEKNDNKDKDKVKEKNGKDGDKDKEKTKP